ncbi:MAG TPA: hypothetical protein VGF88_06630 [Acidobacteriaceae bacterium]|jgi:hypothetical protein
MSPADNTQQLRGEALRARAMIANAVCAIAASEVHGGMLDRAIANLRVIYTIVEEINAHITAPNELTVSAARELGELIDDLQGRIAAIEKLIKGFHATSEGTPRK